MKINEHHYRVLAALRAATVLKREPGTLTPDGHHRMHSLADLMTAGLLFDQDAHAHAAAEGLRKNGLVTRRTYFSKPYYAITSEALVLLAGLEAHAGMSDVIAAELDMAQAQEDIRQARKREREAEERLIDAYTVLFMTRDMRPSAAEIVAGQAAAS